MSWETYDRNKQTKKIFSPFEIKFVLRPEHQQYCFLIPAFPNSEDFIVSELTVS